MIEYPFAMEKGKRYAPYTRSMREPNQLAVWCINHAQEVFINDLEQEYSPLHRACAAGVWRR